MQGLIKKITRLWVRLYRTIGGKFGPASDNLESFEDVATLTSDDKEMAFQGEYDRAGYVFIVQDSPFPLTVLCLLALVETSEDNA